MSLNTYIQESSSLLASCDWAEDTVQKLVARVATSLRDRFPLLICGNGGSMADALHCTAEFVGRFKQIRDGLPAICLGANPASFSAIGNDFEYRNTFAREVEAYGYFCDHLWIFSTSGASPNVINAAKKAKGLGIYVTGFLGQNRGSVEEYCDFTFKVPSFDPAQIQQVHSVLYHYLCGEIESYIVSHLT